MAGVQITGKTLPLNNGAFPVFEDIYGQGGWRSVANIAARNAIPANSRKEGMVVVCIDTDIAWQLISGILDVNWTQLPGTFYQTMENSDGGALPQEPILHWSADFTLTDSGGTTRVAMTRPPLPNVTGADNGDILTVVAGLWTAEPSAVPNIAGLTNVSGITGTRVWVVDQDEYYQLDTTNTFAVFSPLIIAATGGGNWFRRSKKYVVGNFTLWVGSDGGLWGFTPGQLLVTGTIDPDIVCSPSDINATYNFVTPDILGNIWLSLGNSSSGTAAKIALKDALASGTPTPSVLITTTIAAQGSQAVAFDKQNSLWVFGSDGAVLGELEKFSQPQYANTGTSIPSIRISFATRVSITDMVFDQFGNLWVTTENSVGLKTVSMFSTAQLLTSTAVAVPAVVWSGANFVTPHGLAFGPTGLLWVADNGNGGTTSRLKAFDPKAPVTGNQAPLITINTAEFLNGGAGKLAFDSSGNLWVMIETEGVLIRFSAASLAASGTVAPTAIISTNAAASMFGISYPNNPTRSGLVSSGMPVIS